MRCSSKQLSYDPYGPCKRVKSAVMKDNINERQRSFMNWRMYNIQQSCTQIPQWAIAAIEWVEGEMDW